jgi:hypothetical protein
MPRAASVGVRRRLAPAAPKPREAMQNSVRNHVDVSVRARWIVVVLALAGATCLAVAVMSPRVGPWWTVGEIAAIGPGGTSVCMPGAECTRDDLDWIGGGELWRRAGVATMAAGVIAALALVAVAAALASRRRGRLAAGAAISAIATAVAAGTVFVAAFPGLGVTGLDVVTAPPSLDRGALLHLAGAVAGLTAAVITLTAGRRAAS